MIRCKGSSAAGCSSALLLLLIGSTLCVLAALEDSETCSASSQGGELNCPKCDITDDTLSQQEEVLKSFQRIDELLEESWTRVRKLRDELQEQERLIAELKSAARVPVEDAKPLRPDIVHGEENWLERAGRYSGGPSEGKHTGETAIVTSILNRHAFTCAWRSSALSL